jgi:hypothetical protein
MHHVRNWLFTRSILQEEKSSTESHFTTIRNRRVHNARIGSAVRETSEIVGQFRLTNGEDPKKYSAWHDSLPRVVKVDSFRDDSLAHTEQKIQVCR